MRISDHFYTSLKLSQYIDNNTLCKYKDRNTCLHNMCWHIYGLLESGKNVHLILDSKEDLQVVNYYISKYGLSDIVSIIMDNQSIGMADSETKTYDKKQIDEVASKFVQQLDSVKKRIKELTSPCHRNMSIVELNDRQLISDKEVNFSISSENLLNKISHDDFLYKKRLLRKAQEIYEPAFRHLDRLNPFVANVMQSDLAGVQSYLSDIVSDVNQLNKKIGQIEREISSVENKKLILKINNLRQIEKNVNQLHKLDNHLYTDTERAKVVHYIRQLKAELGDKSIIENDLNAEIRNITNAIELYIETQKSLTNNKLIELYEKMTAHSSEYDIKSLYDELEALQERLNAAELFSKYYNRKPLSFYSIKVIIEELYKDIDYALFFLDYNDNYLRWNNYLQSLTQRDKEIITYFLYEKSSWEDSLEDQLSQIRIKDSLLRIGSVEQALDGIYHRLRDCIESKFTLSSLYSTISDNEAIIPIKIFCNSDVPTPAGLDPNVTLITLNKIPENVLDYNQIKVFTYKQEFDISSNKVLRSIPDMDIINDVTVHYSIAKKLQQLKSHELNMASLYLGQLLASISTDYHIYKMKSVAVISFLSEYKNAQIREALYDQGIKEIFSNVDDYNLLPGLFSDTDVQPIVLIEDGLIDGRKEETLVKQIIVREELTIAGVDVIVVDNNKLINNEMELDMISKIIADKNRG